MLCYFGADILINLKDVNYKKYEQKIDSNQI